MKIQQCLPGSIKTPRFLGVSSGLVSQAAAPLGFCWVRDGVRQAGARDGVRQAVGQLEQA